MINARDLEKVVSRHHKRTQSPLVHLRAAGKGVLVSSSNTTGMRLITKVSGDSNTVNACVNAKALASLLKTDDQVQLTVDKGRLLVVGKGMHGDISLESEDQPEVPKLKQSTDVGSDTKLLHSLLPKMDVGKLDRGGQLSVRAKNGELFVSFADDVHGAVFYGKSRSNFEFGMFPQDVKLLTDLMSGEEVAVAPAEGCMVVRSTNEIAVIPTTECKYTTRDEAKSNIIGLVDSDSLRAALVATSYITSSKDTSPVQFKLTKGNLTVGATSPGGSVLRNVRSKLVDRDVQFGINYHLIDDIVSRLTGNVRMGIFIEKGVVVRAHFYCNEVGYLALTSVV